MQNITIAIVADNAAVRQRMRETLSASGYAVLEYDSRMLANLGDIKGAYTICLGAENANQLSLMQRWITHQPELPVIVVGPETLAKEAMENGAYDFIPEANLARLVREIKHAVEKRELTETVNQLRAELTSRDHGTGDMVVPLRELERRAIARALQATKGSVTKAAKLLGIGRATLYRRLASPELANLRPRRGSYDNASSPQSANTAPIQ